VTAPSQAAALAALEDEAYLATTLDAIARERRRLSDGIAALGSHRPDRRQFRLGQDGEPAAASPRSSASAAS